MGGSGNEGTQPLINHGNNEAWTKPHLDHLSYVCFLSPACVLLN